MSEETFEDRTHCPKCKEAGEETSSVPAPEAPKGTTLKTIYCRNKRCRWFDTCWMVQVNPDGSVPEPVDHSKKPKSYLGFETHKEEAAQIMAALERDRQASMNPHSEIRKR